MAPPRAPWLSSATAPISHDYDEALVTMKRYIFDFKCIEGRRSKLREERKKVLQSVGKDGPKSDEVQEADAATAISGESELRDALNKIRDLDDQEAELGDYLILKLMIPTMEKQLRELDGIHKAYVRQLKGYVRHAASEGALKSFAEGEGGRGIMTSKYHEISESSGSQVSGSGSSSRRWGWVVSEDQDRELGTAGEGSSSGDGSAEVIGSGTTGVDDDILAFSNGNATDAVPREGEDNRQQESKTGDEAEVVSTLQQPENEVPKTLVTAAVPPENVDDKEVVVEEEQLKNVQLDTQMAETVDEQLSTPSSSPRTDNRDDSATITTITTLSSHYYASEPPLSRAGELAEGSDPEPSAENALRAKTLNRLRSKFRLIRSLSARKKRDN